MRVMNKRGVQWHRKIAIATKEKDNDDIGDDDNDEESWLEGEKSEVFQVRTANVA